MSFLSGTCKGESVATANKVITALNTIVITNNFKSIQSNITIVINSSQSPTLYNNSHSIANDNSHRAPSRNPA